MSSGFYLACLLGSSSRREDPGNDREVEGFCAATISVITLIGCLFAEF